MKKFRVYDTVNNEYLVNSKDLFICANGKIFHRLKNGSMVERDDCIVEWESELSKEAGYTVYEGDVVLFSYINDTKVIGIVQHAEAKIIYADGPLPVSDQRKICTIYPKGNIHFDSEYSLLWSKII